MTSVDDINSLESEAGIIASLIHKPDFIFYSEYLLPKQNLWRYGYLRNRSCASDYDR